MPTSDSSQREWSDVIFRHIQGEEGGEIAYTLLLARCCRASREEITSDHPIHEAIASLEARKMVFVHRDEEGNIYALELVDKPDDSEEHSE